MSVSAKASRYSKVAITLHWVMALMIIGLLAFGILMTNENVPNRFVLYQWHKSFGITILFLTVLRLIWRLMHNPPALPPSITSSMKSWEIMASKLVHVGFYVLMIAMPLLGWAMVSASKLPIPTVLYGVLPWPDMPGIARDEQMANLFKRLHDIGGKMMILLLLLHIGGAMKHHFVHRDGLLSRMGIGRLPEQD